MPQITVNLIHDLKARHHLPKEKVPFLYGLRTGFLRAWLFTAVKVLFIFALMSGMNISGKIEENIGLLDQLIRNDFGVAQYVPPVRDNLASKATKVVNFEEGPLEPRGPALEPGSVAGEVTESNPFYPTNKNNQGKVAGDNSVAINTTTQNGQQSLEDYIDQVVRYNLVNAIAARFILPGTGDLSDGCLQIDSNNVVTTRGSRCGGGGGGSSGGGGSLAIGSAVTSSTDNSVLFVGTGGVLAQDNTNFAFDDTTDALTVGGDINIGGDLIVGDLAGSGVRCLQTDNSGNVSIAAGGCGGGGSQTPWMQDIDGAGFDLQNVGNINGLIITPNTATITTGIWNGTAITDAFVSDTLTASNLVGSGSTTNAVDLATAEVNGLLPVANGGTGVSTLTSNGVLYGNTTGAIQATAQGGANTVLIANNGAPSFSAAITVGTSVTSPTINATTALQVGGVDINTAGTLSNVAYLNQANVFSQNQSITGNLSVTSANTTQTTTNSALSLVANSLTSGTGLNVTSSSLTSGTLLNLNSNGTAALSGQTGLNVNLNGINGTAGQTSYGAQISNNHSGATSTNVGLAVTVASGTTANYAAIFNGGNVGIGTTQPQGLLNVMQSADDATVSTGLALYVGATAGSELTASSGIQQFAQIAPVINQSGTAGYTVLSVQSGENATGSGTKTLIDGRVDGAEMFAVRNTGAITSAVLAGGGTQCLQTNNSGVISATGSACGAGGGGDSVSVNGSGATDANFIDTAATGTIAAVTWSLNTTPSPDEISLVVGTASATEAGIVNTSSQTFAGAKTFTSNITITKDDAAILFTDSNGDTDFWAGVTEDAGNDDDDFFQIGDGSTPGTNPFLTIDTSGNVGIGTLAPDAALTVSRSGADASATFYSASATDWQGIYLSARRSRGTVSAPSDVLSGDSIVALNGYGYANSGYRFGGTLGFTLEGSPSGSNLPTYFSLWNSSAAAGGAERLRVISTGELGLGTTAPAKQLEVNSATGNNLRLTYNDSDGSAANYADLLMSSSGDLTVTASGSDTLITSNLVVGSGTSATETISNIGYVYNGDDLFVAGMAGVEGNIYSDGSFIAGNGTTYGNGSIEQAAGQTLDIDTDGASLALTVQNSGNITLTAPGSIFLVANTRVTGTLAATSVIQGGSSSTVAYSRLGTTTTDHSLGAADDLLIGDDLEVDGDAFFDGNLTVTGTCTGCGGGSSTLNSITAATADDTNNDNTDKQISWDWSTPTTQNAFTLTNSGTGLTSGSVFKVSSATTGAVTNGIVQILSSGAYTGTGGLLNVTSATATGNVITVADSAAMTTTGKLLSLTANAATTTTGLITKSATGLTTGFLDSSTLGSALTTGGALNLTGASYLHTGSETGKLLNIAYTDASSNGAGTATTVGIALAPTFNTTASAGAKVLQGIDVTPVFTACGTTAGSCTYSGIQSTTAALTQSTTNSMTMNAYAVTAPGALVQNTAAGSLTWNGLNITMPNITQTTGTVTSTGIKITGGTVTSGTSYALTTDSAAGFVGIGTTAPASLLHVNNTTSYSVSANANYAVATIQGAITEAGSGTHAVFAGLQIDPPTITGAAAAVTSAATLYVSNGINASGASNYGLWIDGDDTNRIDGLLELRDNTNTNRFKFDTTDAFYMASGYAIKFGSSGITSPDTGLLRNAAGVLEINSSVAGTYRDLILRNLTANGTMNGTVQSATALTVTRTGTNYAFQVDTNTASSATGLKVTAAAAAGGVALATISSGTNEFFTIDAKGSGEVRIGGSSTGDILLGGGSGSTGCTVTNSSGVLACTSNIASGGVLQAGSTSTVAYSRLGTTTTGHSLGAADDLLIGDDLEVDGDSFFDGNMTTAGNGFMTGFGAYFNIEQGHLCVDDSAGSACPLGGGSLGTIYAVDVNIQGIDLAETYPSKDTTLQPGELVMVDTANNEYIKRAAAGAGDLVIGVVSTDPGITLGGFKPIDYDNDRQYPIALVGRVPVKVTAENGAINSGDYLRPSATVPGAAMKAIGAGPVIGQALESFAGDGTISAFIKATYYDGGSGNLVGQGSTGGSLQGSNLGINIPGNTPLVLASHLYLTGDNIGEAKILAGDTSVRVNFDRPYEYQPIVTATPEGRVGSEYWISDKDSTGFTIYIDEESNDDIIFDWHSFAGEGAKLTVSNGTQQEITLVVLSNNDGSGSGNDPGSTLEPQTEPSPEPNPDPETPPQDGGEVAGDQDTPQDNSLTETPASEPPTTE